MPTQKITVDNVACLYCGKTAFEKIVFEKVPSKRGDNVLDTQIHHIVENKDVEAICPSPRAADGVHVIDFLDALW